MGVIWNKVWFDIWGNKTRSLLVILSIAAGVFAIGAIFGMVNQLLSGMDSAHTEVFPSHINVILRDYVTESVVEDLKSVPGLEDIDPVNQITIRYKLDPDDDWELGTLVERPDYDEQTYDLLALKEGMWPGTDGMAVERMTAQFFGMEIGDEVIFDNGDDQVSYELTGIVRHPFVEPPPFGGQAHFFTNAEGLAEFGIPEGYYGQLLVRVNEFSLEEAQQVAAEIRSRLADQGIGVVVTLYQDPDEHWGRMFVEGVTLVLQVMAIVSMFLSVVIVFNSMTALITQQTDQIGVMKAVGGNRRTIIQVYLAEVMIYTVIAMFIAVPFSLVFAYFMSRNFLNLFNIDYQTFQYSTNALLIQLLIGFSIPILSALWPVLKGARISVREAIASYGIGADFGSSMLDRWIEKLGTYLLPTAYAASLGNIFRRKGRLILTQLVLISAGIMFLMTMTLVSSINYTLDNETARQKYDIRIGFFSSRPGAEMLDVIDDVPEIDDAQVRFSRNATLLRAGERLQDSAGLGSQLIGVPAGMAMYEPYIVSGRWLQPGDEKAFVVSQETAEKNDIEIGDQITIDLGDLGENQGEVVGTYRIIYGTGFEIEPIYTPLESMRSITGGGDQANQVLLTRDISDLDQRPIRQPIRDLIDNGLTSDISALEQETLLLEKLITLFEEAGIQVDFYTTTAKLEARDYADNQFGTVIAMFINLSILVAVVGGIGLMGSLGISVVERRREIGVMRAIGAGSASIRGIMIMEGVFQSLLSFLITVPLAYLLAQPLARALGQTMLSIDLDFAFNYSGLLIWLAVIIVIGVIASLFPSRSATRVSVRESLAYA
jgi:putative ABC transport system permease protein